MTASSDALRRLLSAPRNPSVDRDWLNSTTALRGALAAALLAAAVPHPAQAMPQGGSVVSGNATITQTGNQLKVVQTTPKVAINWQSYGIGANEIVTYYQPNAKAIALNRVLGGGTSNIYGQLSANGQIWISNPSGIFFGPGSRVNVGGLIATTHDLKVEDFNADRYHFQSDTQPPGIIENQGNITIAEAGLAAFVAPGVVNHGVVTARLGQVTLASGNEFTVDLYGDQKINIALDNKTAQQVFGRDGQPLNALVKNDGQIFADGGRVQITAAAAKGIVDNVISVGGLIEARSVQQVNGEIILGGEGGGVQVTGTLDASGKAAGQTGGTVTVTGDTVTVKAGARIDVSGYAGGGQALIGGDFRGGNATTADYVEYNIVPAHKPVPPAVTTTVEAGTVIDADALTSGKGGEIIAWSDAATTVTGILSARGGAQGGGGGFIETSGHWLDVSGISASTKATQGINGTWLLDPYNVTINTTGITQTVSGAGGTVPATANNSVIDASTLAAALNGGNNVTITTGSGGFQTGDITVAAPISWTTGVTLSLDAYHSVLVSANISASGTGAGLAVTYNDGGSGGSLSTGLGAVVTLSGATASLRVNGTPYTLIRTANELQSMGPTGSWALAGGINAGGISNFVPIGTSGGNFSGTLDGLGNIVSGVTVSNASSNYLGLFAGIASSGTVRNLVLTNESITGGSYLGLLAGYSAGTVFNVSATGSVISGNGTSIIGGLIGDSEGGGILFSSAGGSVNVGDTVRYVGGLVGLSHTTVTNSYSSTSVTAGMNVNFLGGLIGSYNTLAVSGSWETGPVSAGNGASNVGGLIGEAYGGTITNSYATGDVTVGNNASYIGGAAGVDHMVLIGVHATGSVSAGTGTGSLGGLTGFTDNTVSSSYATGSVSVGSGSNRIGGLIGDASAGALSSSYATGLVTVGDSATYVGGALGVGHMTATDLYSTGPVSVGTAASFIGGLIGSNNANVTRGYATGGVSAGHGAYEIGGLVGELYGGTVTSVYATGAVTVTDSANYIGGLAGYNGGTLTTGYALGAVTGTGQNIGGLIGGNGGPVSGTYSIGTVSAGSGSTSVGGLIGSNNNNVASSYATGSVSVGSGSNWIGGLIGNATAGTLSSSYATGSVTVGDSATYVGGALGVGHMTATDLYSTGPVSVGTAASFIGGLIGSNNANLTRGHATGGVSAGHGAYEIGGLVGELYGGTVTSVYATGAVTVTDSANYIGGLAGYNGGTLTAGYALGAVTGTGQNIGGLIGGNGGSVSATYSTGAISAGSGSTSVGGLIGSNGGPVSTSYWDTDTSGRGTSSAGSGLTDAAIKMAASYSGWDFTNTWTTRGDEIYPTLITNPRTMPLTWTLSSAVGTYGSAASLGSATFGGLVSADIGNVSAVLALFDTNGSPVTVSPSLAVGTYTEKVAGLGGAAAGNYTLSSGGNTVGIFTVTPAILTYFADPAVMTAGGSVPPLTGTVLGFMGSDTLVSATTGALRFTTDATSLSGVATYAITGYGLAANYGNYTFVQASGNASALTVNIAQAVSAPTPAPTTTTTTTTNSTDISHADENINNVVNSPNVIVQSSAPLQVITGVLVSAVTGTQGLMPVFSPDVGGVQAPGTQTGQTTQAAASGSDAPATTDNMTSTPSQTADPTPVASVAPVNSVALQAPITSGPALVMVASVPVLTTPAAPTLAQLSAAPQVQQGLQTVSNALTMATSGEGSVHDTLVSLNAGSTKLSMQEQKAVFANVPTPKLVNGLLSSSSPVDKAVGGQLQQVSGGNVGMTLGDVKVVLAKAGVTGPTALTYLAMYQVVHKEAMTNLFKGALQELTANPNVADVANVSASTPARGTRSASGITATDNGAATKAAVPREAFSQIVLPKVSSGTDAAGRAVIRGRIDNWQPGMDVSQRSVGPGAIQVASLDGGSIEELLGTPAPRQVAETAPTKIEGWTGGRQVRLNGRWIFVRDDGSFEVVLPAGAEKGEVKLTIVDESGQVHEQTPAVQVAPGGVAKGAQPRKIAVLFANSAYSQNGIPDLNTPANDVARVSETLHNKLGFVTRVISNATKADMVQAIEALHSEATEGDQVFIYYAGHGYENERTGVGYWLPTDATTTSAKNWMSTRDLARLLRRVPAKNIMLVADSCYSGSFTKEQNFEAGSRVANLEELGNLRGVMAMSSGGDEPVMDGEVNSPFARALVDRMKEVTSTTAGEQLYTKIKADVMNNTPQTPQYGVISSAGYDPGADYLIRDNRARVSAR